MKRCGDDGKRKYYALHLYGGPFQEWGGGFGRSLKCMNTDSSGGDNLPLPWNTSLNINKYLCGAKQTTAVEYPEETSLAACHWVRKKPKADRTDAEQKMVSVCPQRDLNYARDGKPDETDEPFMTGMALDMSDHLMHDPGDPKDAETGGTQVRGWEGIAFWARRSPNSQPGIRVAVADKYVDDDMMYLSEKYDPSRPRYCERNVQCGCTNSKPCTPVKAKWLKFDIDGNRVRYAQDPDHDDVNLCLRVPAIRDGRSMINLSGEVVKDANGKPMTWPDGKEVKPYNGCPSTDKGANGQPWQTDVYEDNTYEFCFDPAVDPVPPEGTRADLINHRIFQQDSPLDTLFAPAPGMEANASAPVNNYKLCQENYFGSYAQDSWIRLFCNPNEHSGYNYQACGNSLCGIEYPSYQGPDPKSRGRTCNEFSFVGGITRSFCYTPGQDPNPYEGTQTCGDFWMKTVAIGVDWTFVKVPFSMLLQQGWAKRQYQFDLSSITNVRFQWERGWMDYQISDVRFYRTKQ